MIWDILGFVIIILSLAVITFTGGVFTDAMPEISSPDPESAVDF